METTAGQLHSVIIRRNGGRGCRCAFTLMELIMGMIVTGLVMAAIAALLSAVAMGWDQSGKSQTNSVYRVQTHARIQRILKGVKQQVQKGELVPAGKRFIRASTALGKSVSQIAAVPQPVEDTAKLDKWIGYLKKEKVYLQKIGKYLKAEDKYRAQKQAVELNRNNNKANNTVISFGFHECRIDSSKFL